jgi:transposase-like protein
MKRGRFTEEQIIAVLREHEAGAKTGELARKHGILEATLYKWAYQMPRLQSPLDESSVAGQDTSLAHN